MAPPKSANSPIGLFVLIKWPNIENCWDNYPIKCLKDVGLACKIASATDYTQFMNVEVDVNWKEGEKASPGLIMGVGTAAEMERKRKRESSKNNNRPTNKTEAHKKQHLEILTNLEEYKNSREDKLIQKNEKLKKENKLLKEEIEKLQNLSEMASWLRRLKKCTSKLENIVSNGSANGPSATSEGKEFEMVDLGNGVQIRKAEVINLEHSCNGNGTFFARSLLTGLFTHAEICEGSISGKKSNAFKDREAKNQLDPVKINAIIDFTMNKFQVTKKELKQSIQSKIKEVRRKSEIKNLSINKELEINKINSSAAEASGVNNEDGGNEHAHATDMDVEVNNEEQ